MSLVCPVAYNTDHIFPLSARFAAIHLSVPRGARASRLVFATNYVAALIYTVSCIQSRIEMPVHRRGTIASLSPAISPFRGYKDDNKSARIRLGERLGVLLSPNTNGNPYMSVKTKRIAVVIHIHISRKRRKPLLRGSIPVSFHFTLSYPQKWPQTFSNAYINITSSIILNPGLN